MPRPFPIVPRGPRRRRPARLPLVLACPTISPDFQIDAVQALMKPKPFRREALRHRTAGQPWPEGADQALQEALDLLKDRLAWRPEVHRPPAGDVHLLVPVAPGHDEHVKALAVLLSRRLPGLWLTLGRLLVRDGRFYRRRFGYKLEVVPATNVHLRRDLRAALKGAI